MKTNDGDGIKGERSEKEVNNQYAFSLIKLIMWHYLSYHPFLLVRYIIYRKC